MSDDDLDGFDISYVGHPEDLSLALSLILRVVHAKTNGEALGAVMEYRKAVKGQTLVPSDMVLVHKDVLTKAAAPQVPGGREASGNARPLASSPADAAPKIRQAVDTQFYCWKCFRLEPRECDRQDCNYYAGTSL